MSRPSSRTLAAMVDSSNTIDLTPRPPVRRKVSANADIDPHRRRAWLRHEQVTSTHPRYPDYCPIDLHNRPIRPTTPGYSSLLHTPHHQSGAATAKRPDPVA